MAVPQGGAQHLVMTPGGGGGGHRPGGQHGYVGIGTGGDERPEKRQRLYAAGPGQGPGPGQGHITEPLTRDSFCPGVALLPRTGLSYFPVSAESLCPRGLIVSS